MAGSWNDYLEDKALDYVFSVAAFTPAATLYYALYTVAPSDTGGGTEVTGGAYTRKSVTNDATNFPASSGGSKSNGVAITFTTATASWGTVVAFALIDASSGGNFYCWGDLTINKTVSSGDTASFAVGAVVLTLD